MMGYLFLAALTGVGVFDLISIFKEKQYKEAVVYILLVLAAASAGIMQFWGPYEFRLATLIFGK